ncbi:MAG: hypothetical protein NVSMB14_15540 [Isosphaeraceae bacterium]
MNVVNSKKKNPVASFGFEWAGAMAQVRRGGLTGRPSRRSALLGALTASYANASRNGRANEVRGGTGERTA